MSRAPRTTPAATPRPPSPAAALALSLVVLTAAVAGGLAVGGVVIDPLRAARALGSPDSLDHLRVWELRAPRVATGALAGAAYAVAGSLLQRGLGNRLAVPELLGVSAGAACAVAVPLVAGWSAGPAAGTPLFALVGALGGGALTLLLSAGVRDRVSLVLVGTAVSAALSALTVTAAALAERLQLQALLRYLAGGLNGIGADTALVVAAWTLPVLAVALLAAPTSRLLALGDDAAGALGLPPAAARVALLALAALLVAAPTAVTGPIAWVGLVVPLVTARLLPTAPPAVEAAVCATLGAAAVVVADAVARALLHPVETPLGAWTAPASLAVAVLVLPAAGTSSRLVSRVGRRR